MLGKKAKLSHWIELNPENNVFALSHMHSDAARSVLCRLSPTFTQVLGVFFCIPSYTISNHAVGTLMSLLYGAVLLERVRQTDQAGRAAPALSCPVFSHRNLVLTTLRMQRHPVFHCSSLNALDPASGR